MGLLEAIRTAFAALFANRLRSFLTMLGSVVGVVAVVSVISITQGLNRYVAQELLSMGSHIFTINKFGFITDHESFIAANRRKNITSEDALYLKNQMTTAAVIVPSVGRGTEVSWRDKSASDIPLQGIGEGYADLGDDYELASGRHFTDQEIASRRRAIIIGWEIAEEIFGAIDPIGKRIRVNRESFWITGVLAERGSVLGQSRDNVLYIPITSYESIFGSRQSINISILAASPEVFIECQEQAEMLLKIKRGGQPWEDPDFGLQTSESIYGFYETQTRLFYLGMIVVVGLSLIVGGIVMMNIMLVSVMERTREIGIRKAVGARRRDITRQFLVEAAVLAISGALIGVFLGGLVSVLVKTFSPLPTRLEPWSIVISLTLAASVGLLSGLYPAVRAAKLPPVTALNYEK
jgi:putative ABC transport system permease protein